MASPDPSGEHVWFFSISPALRAGLSLQHTPTRPSCPFQTQSRSITSRAIPPASEVLVRFFQGQMSGSGGDEPLDPFLSGSREWHLDM